LCSVCPRGFCWAPCGPPLGGDWLVVTFIGIDEIRSANCCLTRRSLNRRHTPGFASLVTAAAVAAAGAERLVPLLHFEELRRQQQVEDGAALALAPHLSAAGTGDNEADVFPK